MKKYILILILLIILTLVTVYLVEYTNVNSYYLGCIFGSLIFTPLGFYIENLILEKKRRKQTLKDMWISGKCPKYKDVFPDKK